MPSLEGTRTLWILVHELPPSQRVSAQQRR